MISRPELVVARTTGIPVLLLGCRYYSAWRLRSWDRFYLPAPWSRVEVALRAGARRMDGRPGRSRAQARRAPAGTQSGLNRAAVRTRD